MSNDLRNEINKHLSDYYLDPEVQDPEDCTEDMLRIFEKALKYNIEEIRKDLKNCTPEEYWLYQGEISGLKKFIDRFIRKQNSTTL